MYAILVFLPYIAAITFVAVIAVRVVRIARLPLHLRWELYPVAHEKQRARYGGSYLEELDWWTKPRQRSVLGELKVMLPEILLLDGVRHNNVGHWVRTFPFHLGLYLSAGLLVLLVAGGIATATGAAVGPEAAAIGRALHHLTYVVGYGGLGLGFLGALALLVRRSVNVDYREFTKPVDFFNLGFFIVTFGVALAFHTAVDPEFVALREFLGRTITLDVSAALSTGPSALMAAEIALGCLLLAYIPATHMAHFFMKWFMYHDIRWSDEPSVSGGKLERQIAEALQYRVSWAAPHIRGGGTKTWADVATSGVEEVTE